VDSIGEKYNKLFFSDFYYIKVKLFVFWTNYFHLYPKNIYRRNDRMVKILTILTKSCQINDLYVWKNTQSTDALKFRRHESQCHGSFVLSLIHDEFIFSGLLKFWWIPATTFKNTIFCFSQILYCIKVKLFVFWTKPTWLIGGGVSHVRRFFSSNRSLSSSSRCATLHTSLFTDVTLWYK